MWTLLHELPIPHPHPHPDPLALMALAGAVVLGGFLFYRWVLRARNRR